MKKLIRKLKQNKGESLTEVLIGLLIACIATAMFAAMLQGSTNIMQSSGETLENYYAANEVLSTQDKDLSSETNRGKYVKNVSLNLVSVKNLGDTEGKSIPKTVQLQPGANSIQVGYYFNSETQTESSKIKVASYRIYEEDEGGDDNE